MANDDTLGLLRSIARGETTSQMREIEEGFGLFDEPYREGDCLKEEKAVQKYRKKLTSIVKSRKTGIHKILKKCRFSRNGLKLDRYRFQIGRFHGQF